MELVAVHIKTNNIIARRTVAVPKYVPLDIKCHLGEYKEAYLRKAKELFEEDLKQNRNKGFNVYARVESVMSEIEVD